MRYNQASFLGFWSKQPVTFPEMRQGLEGAGLKAEMEYNFGYIKFAISLVIQVKISVRHLSLEVRKGIRTGNVNLDFLSI